MGMHNGLYDELITKVLEGRLSELPEEEHFKMIEALGEEQSVDHLTESLTALLRQVLASFSGETKVEKRVEFANELIQWLHSKGYVDEVQEHEVNSPGRVLKALYNRQNPVARNLEKHAKEIRPYSGLKSSELFTGRNNSHSMENELRREILSADEIWWIVSFVKWSGLRIFEEELLRAARSGTKIRVITTTYIGATEAKAVEFLSNLPNTEVRLSYNTQSERLHAKAYLFMRNSGFDTGYIGSSNISRAALSQGLEWNLKVTRSQNQNIIEAFKSTFQAYWQSSEFEEFSASNSEHKERLTAALKSERRVQGNDYDDYVPFDVKPHAYQQEMLDRLRSEREVHGRKRNLVVAATGTGKTMLAAFDFKRFYIKNPQAKLLFVAHREEIIRQARATFRGILKQREFGELWGAGEQPSSYDIIFATVQTLNSQLEQSSLSQDYYDVVIVDEVHHGAASSYRQLFEYFQPEILLGLTATPERNDGENILKDFCGVIAAELRLPEAINQRHLSPFQYFGVDDDTDLTSVDWVSGRYKVSDLTELYLANSNRIHNIVASLEQIVSNVGSMRALAFCASIRHAEFMSNSLNAYGINSAFLTSASGGDDRRGLRQKLVQREINVLCVVDIFNEGVDIPEIDTVLFLRPTESLTIFLQQLGRGLRLSDGKECLTVLDFVGNARPEYDYSSKFQSLIGKTHTSVEHHIKEGFPTLPLGCSIVLQKQAKEKILRNIKAATVNWRTLRNLVAAFQHSSDSELTIQNFLVKHPSVSIANIYKGSDRGWTNLLVETEIIEAPIDPTLVKKAESALWNRMLQTTSRTYIEFVRNLMSDAGAWDAEEDRLNTFALMVHYDLLQVEQGKLEVESVSDAIQLLVAEPHLRSEIIQVCDYVLETIEQEEQTNGDSGSEVLNLHARYSKDAILAAYGIHTFEKRKEVREGRVKLPNEAGELFFVTLEKESSSFSATTRYHDYAIDESTFHWQSQNTARPDKGVGKTYVEQASNQKKFILFVREQSKDEFDRAMGFVNLGPVIFESSNGSKPMNITWKLATPMPAWIYREAAKMKVV